MGKRKAWFCVLVLALAAVMWAVWPQPEPHYGGRPLNHWVRRLGEDDQLAVAREAIQAVGTNAVPHLLKWIRYEPSRLRNILEGCIRRAVPARVISIPQSRREPLAYGALKAFELLGTNAIAAAPELERMAQDPSARRAAGRAICALGLIGTNGVKGLLVVIDTPSHPLRELAMRALRPMRSKLGPYAEPVAAHLIRCLNAPPTNRTPREAAATLGYLRVAPENSLPALEARLSTRDPELQAECIRALGEFGTQAAHALPRIRAALTNSYVRVCEAAEGAIARIESRGPTDVPLR